MERKAQYKQRLKSELSDLGSEIDKLIVRTDKIAIEIKQGYDEIETALQNKQSLAQANRESLISGNEVWDLVWNAVEEFNRKATTEIKHDYKELEPALKAKQLALQEQLPESIVSGDEVWDEVWNVVWSVGREINRKATKELRQIGKQLEALLVKQSALQSELHELLLSDDEVWNVVKEVTNAMVK